MADSQPANGAESPPVGGAEARPVEPVRTRAAYQALARRELARLLAMARRLSADDPEDLVQEALLRGYQSYRTLDDDHAGGAWLRTILVNVHRDRLRKLARSFEELPVAEPDDYSLYRTIVEKDPFPYSDSVHLDFLHAFSKEDVRQVLLQLPEMYRIPLVLCHMDGWSTKEVARHYDLPLGTVLARLHRGRKAFERQMWTYAAAMGLLKKRSAG